MTQELKVVLERESATTARYDARLDVAELMKAAALDLAIACVYLDPNTALPDDQASAYCSRCGAVAPACVALRHVETCPVGRILDLAYPKGGLVDFVRQVSMTHHEAAELHAAESPWREKCGEAL